MNNIHLEKAMLDLKNYCKQFKNCTGCELFDADSCYLYDKVPEEYFSESDKEE